MQLKLMGEKFDLTSAEGVSACERFMQEKLENIDNYIQSLSSTIDDFRNFYNPNKKKNLCSIQEPISKSLDIIKASLASKGIMIEESYHDSSPILMLEGEMMQVFLNIFKNAQDNFMEKKYPKWTYHDRDQRDRGGYHDRDI